MISTQVDVSKIIPGPAGQLELMMGPVPENKRSAWGIICHPHSLHGGTMQNKVVAMLAKTFQYLGVQTVRFNFRGVGKSTGTFDQGNGELEDLLAVVDWVQHQHMQPELWLAGFSFGAFIAAKAASQLPVNTLVTVAPPVENFPMQHLAPIQGRWVLVIGEKDEIVSADKVIAWAEKQNPKPIILRFPAAGHFFHGQLIKLRSELEKTLSTDR